MGAGGAVFLLCAGSMPAIAQPGYAPALPPEPAHPEPAHPELMIEVAGTWSGKTNEPAGGWRAALLKPLEVGNARDAFQLALVGRVDDHGAPAEAGMAETYARSWGVGFRALLATPRSSGLTIGTFAEATAGRTTARHADAMRSQIDTHWMVSGGVMGGTRSVQLVADFGWLVTDAGDGRIGPIASLGVNIAID